MVSKNHGMYYTHTHTHLFANITEEGVSNNREMEINPPNSFHSGKPLDLGQ